MYLDLCLDFFLSSFFFFTCFSYLWLDYTKATISLTKASKHTSSTSCFWLCFVLFLKSPREASTLKLTWKPAWQNLSLLVPAVADGIKPVHMSETLFLKSLLWYCSPRHHWMLVLSLSNASGIECWVDFGQTQQALSWTTRAGCSTHCTQSLQKYISLE